MHVKMKTKQRSLERGDSAPEAETSLLSVPRPSIQWGERSERLAPLMRHNNLPLVVMCDQQTLPFMETINFNFAQPLLLHMRRTVRKVVAASIFYEQCDGVVVRRQAEGRLLIPEDYKGWFAVLGLPDTVTREKVVPHFRQVAQLALSKCQTFLIGGNQPIGAFYIDTSNGGACKPLPRTLYPGDVLKMGTLYAAETTVKVKSGPFRGKKTVKKEEKFLLCTDENDRDVYLPVEKRGVFYVLTMEGQGMPKIPILRMPDIIARSRFPCIVKLIYGRVPPTPCSFTGTLLLQDSYMETSVIACTMFNVKNIFVDVPIDTDLRFFLAENTREVVGSQAYRSAARLCHEKASTYMRNMKVAYYVENNDRDVAEGDAPREQLSQMKVSSSESLPAHLSPRQSQSSRGRPSIVDEQPLFDPPESTSKTSKSPPVDNDSSLTTTVASNSPTVLRKDKTFYLPDEKEVLPLVQKSLSVPHLLMSTRPLPQTPEESSSGGHYMTMEDNARDRSEVTPLHDLPKTEEPKSECRPPQPPSTLSLSKLPPLPPPPKKCSSQPLIFSPESEEYSSRRERPGSVSSTSDTADYTSHLSPVVSRKLDDRMVRKTSFTFYEGRDSEASASCLVDPDLALSPGLYSDFDPEQHFVLTNADESIYVNLQNIVKLEHASEFYDDRNKQIHVRDGSIRFRNPLNEEVTSEDLFKDPDFGAGPSLPPKPCKNPDSYLHPCTDESSSLESSEASSSVVDDLPLGATFSTLVHQTDGASDSGFQMDSVGSHATSTMTDHSLSNMSVPDLMEALQGLGLKPQTLDQLKQEKIDGKLLVSLNETELRDAVPGLRDIDFKKICMFVSGWRPKLGLERQLHN
ncbi:hypothetical protein C0Q70_16632 [Pomacea canaliculata]|uniref:CABIT domain-containing protein n=1 Tax=Pomacea canaliculata TaxID=400727 RepID=A0A2T7NQB3_POMCA|nr:hypothetical protein C0Q70_16632 [Pomacea canaliculata]